MLVWSENLTCREVRVTWQQAELSLTPGWPGQGLFEGGGEEEAAWPAWLLLKILPQEETGFPSEWKPKPIQSSSLGQWPWVL